MYFILNSHQRRAINPSFIQTLNSISAEKNSTIIFPLPIDMISHLMPGCVSKDEDFLVVDVVVATVYGKQI